MANDPDQDSQPDLRVFISYRREDTSGYAGRVYDSVVKRFGEDRVFMDIDTIRPGSDFSEVINEALDVCDVLLALIGRTWLTCTARAAQACQSNGQGFPSPSLTNLQEC